MTPFAILRGIAAPMPDSDVDTDVIFPARFLLLLDKQGLGKHLFHDRRWTTDDQPRDFVLNNPPYDRASLLVAGPRFGSGSSREQAVWTLADFGIRCVIAPSFGEIFYANCFKNGVLPVRADGEPHASMMTAACRGEPFEVNLQACKVSWPGGLFTFDVDAHRRDSLLKGLDEIDIVLAEDAEAVAAFEERRRVSAPWLDLGLKAGGTV